MTVCRGFEKLLFRRVDEQPSVRREYQQAESLDNDMDTLMYPQVTSVLLTGTAKKSPAVPGSYIGTRLGLCPLFDIVMLWARVWHSIAY